MPNEPTTALAPAPLTGAPLMEQIIAERTDPISAPLNFASPLQPTTGVEVSPDADSYGDVQTATESPLEAPADDYQSMTQIEYGLVTLLQNDPDIAADLGAAVLNQMPDLIKFNAPYVLRVLGLPTDAAAAQQQLAEVNRAEYKVAQTLANETRTIFDEYVSKGRQAGLNELEASGLAALAYRAFDERYWQGDTEARKALDTWQVRIRAGANNVQVADARSNYRKLFEAAYRKASAKHIAPGSRPTTIRPGLTGEELMQDVLRENGVIR